MKTKSGWSNYSATILLDRYLIDRTRSDLRPPGVQSYRNVRPEPGVPPDDLLRGLQVGDGLRVEVVAAVRHVEADDVHAAADHGEQPLDRL